MRCLRLWGWSDMIKSINIIQYKKFKDIKLNMVSRINAISGTNGTCKTSLLHIVSNSFQAVKKNDQRLSSEDGLTLVSTMNEVVNPKMESLTRGDKTYNDPGNGVKGPLYSVEYYDNTILSFRRHNSSKNGRYAIKPVYSKGAAESLPSLPVVYLGLTRLVPYGEFKNDNEIKKIRKAIPNDCEQELNDIYKSFTHYEILETSLQHMGTIKTRAEFKSTENGIDSNTISAGEDNLYIILLALQTLKFYFRSIKESKQMVESILLIDELDSTLHPAYQIKLINLIRQYSKDYKIQVFFTTHSMTLLENVLKEKDNLLYFVDNVSSAHLMQEPDMFKIKMHLSSLTKEDIYYDKVIPVFSEDKEARVLIDMILDYLEENCDNFKGLKRMFHLVDVNLGADNLTNIFSDLKLLRSTMKAICIIDGDHNSDLSKNIMTLPGCNKGNKKQNFPPEKLLFNYAEILYNEDDPFWISEAVIGIGYGKIKYIDSIKDQIDKYKKKGNLKEREYYKKIFNDNLPFMRLLFKRWLNDCENKNEIDRFVYDLHSLFKKNAQFNGINPNEWK